MTGNSFHTTFVFRKWFLQGPHSRPLVSRAKLINPDLRLLQFHVLNGEVYRSYSSRGRTSRKIRVVSATRKIGARYLLWRILVNNDWSRSHGNNIRCGMTTCNKYRNELVFFLKNNTIQFEIFPLRSGRPLIELNYMHVREPLNLQVHL